MRPGGRGLPALILVLVLAASCGGAKSRTTPTTTVAASTTSTTTTVEVLAASVTVAPDQGVAGTTFTFTVAVRGPGTLVREAVQFGDGETSGANSGDIDCGGTTRADHTSTYAHTYQQPGNF